jgi:multiple sugar transport system ATP-binding protein
VADVALFGVHKSYDTTPVLRDFSLQVPDGEFCVILGPSGCGKSTLLRLVAGLEAVDSGTIKIGGKDVTGTEPRDRHVAMVFQNYALYPHMTVAENIGFPLKLRKVEAKAAAERIRGVADLLDLSALLERRPRQLSGGQRQRVALGRAIVQEPAVYLLDEPLSNVDALLRVRMRDEIARLWERLRATILYVTHDQSEALSLGTKICVLDSGRVQQTGTSREIYERPRNRFVAGFVGTPPVNMVSGKLRDGDPMRFDPWHWPVPAEVSSQLMAWRDRDVVLAVRPEHLHAGNGAGDGSVLKGSIERVEYLGNVTWVSCKVEGGSLVARAGSDLALSVGQPCHLRVESRFLHWFHPESGERL